MQDLLLLRAGMVREQKKVQDLLNIRDTTILHMTGEIERMKKQNKQLCRKAMKSSSEESSTSSSFSVNSSSPSSSFSNFQERGKLAEESQMSNNTTMSDSGCDIVEDDSVITNNKYRYENNPIDSGPLVDQVKQINYNSGAEGKRQPNPKQSTPSTRHSSPQYTSANNVPHHPVNYVTMVNSVKPPVASRNSVNRKLNIVSSSGFESHGGGSVGSNNPVPREQFGPDSDPAIIVVRDSVLFSEFTSIKDAVSGGKQTKLCDNNEGYKFTSLSDSSGKYQVKSETCHAESNKEEKGPCDLIFNQIYHNIQHITGHVKKEEEDTVKGVPDMANGLQIGTKFEWMDHKNDLESSKNIISCIRDKYDEHTNKTVMTYWTEDFL